MANLTPYFDSILQTQHSTHLNRSPRKRSDTTDEFLKEAYRINAHINSLHNYLLSTRQAYLSSAPAASTASARRTAHPAPLINRQRDELDASSKSLLRTLQAAIQQLSAAAALRQSTMQQLQRRQRGGALRRWANGGAEAETEEETGELRTDKAWRESVLWYLGRGLETAGEIHRGMMERRWEREVERSRSALYMSRGGGVGGGGGRGPKPTNGTATTTPTAARESKARTGTNRHSHSNAETGNLRADEERIIEARLSPEQLQLFAQENNDLLRQYEDTLDQVRTAERSLLEISSLQNTLATNLAAQEQSIAQLVADAQGSTDDVGRGNRELRRAAERGGVARGLFWATCGFSVGLVVWDLVF